ncbi:MAG TPA: ERAP1-like C-terminal domain-containing protein, partial [Thermoanaerobaculia bacterium]|nr:ERAP1-like C-terminal domain-containing protein [Thermoanaerobaculia bacterium]
ADPDPGVAEAFLERLWRTCRDLIPEEQAEPFARYVRRTFQPLLDRIGRDPRPGEPANVSALRSRLLLWLGEEGRDGEILTYGGTLARRYMNDPGSVPPGLIGVALELAAHNGDQALFEEYRRRYETAQTPAEQNRYLRTLGQFGDPAVSRGALRYFLTGPVQGNSLLNLAGTMSQHDSGADLVFAWMQENYEQIAARIPPVILPLLPALTGGCSAGRMEQVRKFFSEPTHSVAGTERQLAAVTDQMSGCLRLRQRESAAVAAFLGSEGGGAP